MGMGVGKRGGQARWQAGPRVHAQARAQIKQGREQPRRQPGVFPPRSQGPLHGARAARHRPGHCPSCACTHPATRPRRPAACPPLAPRAGELSLSAPHLLWKCLLILSRSRYSSLRGSAPLGLSPGTWDGAGDEPGWTERRKAAAQRVAPGQAARKAGAALACAGGPSRRRRLGMLERRPRRPRWPAAPQRVVLQPTAVPTKADHPFTLPPSEVHRALHYLPLPRTYARQPQPCHGCTPGVRPWCHMLCQLAQSALTERHWPPPWRPRHTRPWHR